MQKQAKDINRSVKWRSAFALSVSFLLFLTAIAKVGAILQHKAFLLSSDPVFSKLTIANSLGIAAALELFVALFVIFKRKALSTMVICFWLVAVFVFYHMLTKASFYTKPCSCLGSVPDWLEAVLHLRIARGIFDVLPSLILCYIGIGSLSFLIVEVFDEWKYAQRSLE